MLVVHLALSPGSNNSQMEERFFLNVFGYLEDCRAQGIAPGLFLLELCLHTVHGLLVIPIRGPDFVKARISLIVMLVLGYSRRIPVRT